MKITILSICFAFVWAITACELPQPPADPSQVVSFEDLKVSDLADTSQENIDSEFIMSFRVLTYTIVPGAVDELDKICQMLSQQDVRLLNQEAFKENGLAVGTGSFEQGSEVARKLNEVGAVRVGQAHLTVPPENTQVISRTFLQGTETFTYATSAVTNLEVTPGPGFFGWVFSAQPDSRFNGMVQVRLYPAYWQQGLENIRLLMGQEPVEYRPLDDGTILTRLGERGFLLLVPGRDVPDKLTLDKLLFFMPGQRPKVQFYLIIFDSMGTT